jgi:chromate transporter
VLAYMTQEAVNTHMWLTTEQMIDGLGLAETTPGPLILVTQIVGFIAGSASGWGAAIKAACLTLGVTFVPCFLWIFAGAPYIELIPTRPRLRGALTGITAAVVGVVLNLSVWFALHVFFGTVTQTTIGPMSLPVPDVMTLSPVAVILSCIAGYLILVRKMGLVWVLGILAAMGVAISWV